MALLLELRRPLLYEPLRFWVDFALYEDFFFDVLDCFFWAAGNRLTNNNDDMATSNVFFKLPLPPMWASLGFPGNPYNYTQLMRLLAPTPVKLRGQ